MREIPEDKAKITKQTRERLNQLRKNENILSVHFIDIDDLSKLQKNGRVRIGLPGLNEGIDLTTLRMEYKNEREYNWYATTSDGTGSVIILRKGDDYTGHFSLEGKKEFQIFSEEGQHILIRMKPGKPRGPQCSVVAGDRKENKRVGVQSARMEPCADPIRVLILWTQNAQNTGLNVQNIINTAIAQFNSCIYRSNITSLAAITLAGSQKVNFAETRSISDDWNTLRNDAFIQTLRNNANADIVVLLTNGDYPTYGTIGLFSLHPNDAYAIAQINHAVDDTKTFAHELGHLFDARHENDNSGTAYAHAHKINFPLWRFMRARHTVMICCEDNDVVENFSNPAVSIYDEPTGTWNRDHNARRVSETYSIVRNHRPPVNVLSSYIDGPGYGHVYQYYTWEAVTRCSGGPFTYEWYTSTDGFNWQYRSGNESFGEVLPWTSSNYYYLKLRVSANGQASESYQTIYIDYSQGGARLASAGTPAPPVAPIAWGISQGEQAVANNRLRIEQITPNPTESDFSVEFVNPMEQDILFELVDVSGRTVRSFSRARFGSGRQSKTLKVDNIKPSVYLLKVASETESITEKVMIVKYTFMALRLTLT